ncbi:hypothetical protein HU200_037878 [Digitaria exilis]|uniref:25S rRNA (uridine-N(3))-methyltransferase BMT5-like domain-containing protein n=1 Tax=Digitaria exilis TaxID=1010633 RepID=A0A835BDQ6_9POAL|nr:hypothetical protein HU200_037878 [Digitaria exilis]
MMATIQNSAAHGGGLAGGRARRGGGRGRGAATVRGAGNGGKGEGDGAGTGGGAAGNRRRRRGRDEAEEVEDDEAAEGSEDGVGEEVKWLGLYSSTQSILLVGEGNFSFSLALATAFGSGGNIVATSLDTSEALRNKYGGAESNITSLKRLGATVLHGIDVKTMKSHTDLRNRRFDRIVYNFPHAGFKGKECEVHMIKLHKNLVRGFFRNACHLLRPYGEVHVSHKTGKSYDKWNLEHVAAGFSLILIEKVGFQKAEYPGYNQKKGDGPMCDKPFKLGTCCTFKFKIGNLEKQKKKKRNRRMARPISSIGSNTRPSHLPPLVQALPGLDFPPPATVLSLMTLLPHVDVQRPLSGFQFNFNSMLRAPFFHEVGTVRSMIGMPDPSLNVLGPPGGIPPLMGRATGTSVLDRPQGYPWSGQRFITEPLFFLARECQWSLQREFEMLRQVIPSLNYSSFLEYRYMVSVQRQEGLRRLFANSCQ